MRLVKIFELMVMLIACYAFYISNIYLLLGLLFAAGTTATFFSPMKYSVLPTHLPREELIRGNGLIEGGTFLAILTGSILGTALGDKLDITDPLTSYPLIASIILVSIIGLVAVYNIPEAKSFSTHRINKNIWRGSWHILSIILHDSNLRKAVLSTSWFWLCGSIFLSLFPAYVKEVIGADTHLYTVFLTTFSIGIAIGAASCGKILNDEITPRITHLSLAGVTFFTLLMVWLSTLELKGNGKLLTVSEFFSHIQAWPIFFTMVLMAACWGLYSVPLKAIIQSKASDENRSRVIAGENISNSLFMVLGNIAVGFAIKFGITILEIFAFIGIINIFVAIISKRIWRNYS